MTLPSDSYQCPRCNAQCDSLHGNGKGHYDLITQKRWASAECITGKHDMVCRKCYDEIRMQDPKYVMALKDREEREVFSAFHDAVVRSLESQ